MHTSDLSRHLSNDQERSLRVQSLKALRASLPFFPRLGRMHRKSPPVLNTSQSNEAADADWSGTTKILVKEVNWLGDLVMSLPALRLLRSTFPAAKLSVLIRQDLFGFFEGMDWVDEVIPDAMRSGLSGLADQQKIIAAIRARGFDLAIVFPNSFRSALWMMVAGVPRRAGYATNGRSFLLTDRVIPTRSAIASKEHQRFSWLRMVRDIVGIVAANLDSASDPLEVSPQSAARMRKFLARLRRKPDAPLIALSPIAAYGPAKEWPLQYYARLIDLVGELAGGESVLVGAATDRFRCEQVAAMSHRGAIVAAGQTDIADLKALLSLCHGFAGNDSGAMHLAAAIGIPAVGIFGSTNPSRTGPSGTRARVIYHPIECSPCLKRTCRFGHYQCLHGIAPTEVVEALAQLGSFRAPRPAGFTASS